jgi:prolyl-tRNA synthetase
MRWEMRTRLFLRTSEFLWQEGHTAHADRADAMEETMRMLEVYRTFSEEILAMPVVAGEKPENERFPGAVATYSIEAMMQDGKALQAGTSHYLGTHFSEAQNIRYQDKDGGITLCHTTSWGVSTRLIGGVIMTHGDDDGLRTPPAIAPRQIVIVPMLRDKPEDEDVLAYCRALASDLNKLSAFGAPLRALVDIKQGRSADKRWNWVRRGAPVLVEIGPRDAAGGKVSFMRRDALREGDKVKTHLADRDAFIAGAAELLAEIQNVLLSEARARQDGAMQDNLKTFADLETYFGLGETEEFKGWARVAWSKPSGADLEAIGERLKALKLTIRNAPLDQPKALGKCIFSGGAAVEQVIIARAY